MVADIRMGYGFAMVLDLKGNLWSYGTNLSGELGV
jgi:alpha-tubulin suppressor-like RCC1 family protein